MTVGRACRHVTATLGAALPSIPFFRHSTVPAEIDKLFIGGPLMDAFVFWFAQNDDRWSSLRSHSRGAGGWAFRAPLTLPQIRVASAPRMLLVFNPQGRVPGIFRVVQWRSTTRGNSDSQFEHLSHRWMLHSSKILSRDCGECRLRADVPKRWDRFSTAWSRLLFCGSRCSSRTDFSKPTLRCDVGHCSSAD